MKAMMIFLTAGALCLGAASVGFAEHHESSEAGMPPMGLPQAATYQSRLTTYNITDKGWDWKYEMSMDGTNYMEGAKATYTKK